MVAQINLSDNSLCGLTERLGDLAPFGAYNDEGIKAIASAISVSASLTSINLENNNIGPEGAKAIASEIGHLCHRLANTF